MKYNNTVILIGPSRGSSKEKFLSQNPHFRTKSFIEFNIFVTSLKFEMEIDGYFLSLGEDEFAYIRNPFKPSNALAGIGTKEELFKFEHNGFARDVYFDK